MISKDDKPIIKVNQIEQVAIVVRDVDKSAEAMWKNFGIGPWAIKTVKVEDALYHGKPAIINFRLARTMNKLGGMEIELQQPLEGESIYRDFLDEHGEGIHHLGWYRVNSKEEFDETMKAMVDAGFPCLMTFRFKNTAVAYFDTTKAMNTIFEIMWIDPSAVTSAPPDYIYPKP